MWTSRNMVTLYDWLQLIAAVLEDGLQVQWKCYQRKKTKALEHQGRARGFEASQDQIHSEGHYADPDSQDTYNEYILFLCYTEALNAWDKIQEPGIKIESNTKVIKGPREPFSDF